MTKFLRDANSSKVINISNYWTGYTDFQIQSHRDLINILTDIYDYHQYINLWEDREQLFAQKSHLYPAYLRKAAEFREKYPNLPRNI